MLETNLLSLNEYICQFINSPEDPSCPRFWVSILSELIPLPGSADISDHIEFFIYVFLKNICCIFFLNNIVFIFPSLIGKNRSFPSSYQGSLACLIIKLTENTLRRKIISCKNLKKMRNKVAKARNYLLLDNKKIINLWRIMKSVLWLVVRK